MVITPGGPVSLCFHCIVLLGSGKALTPSLDAFSDDLKDFFNLSKLTGYHLQNLDFFVARHLPHPPFIPTNKKPQPSASF